MGELLEYLGVAALITLMFAATAEVAILGIAWYYADEVECNWLWCTFTIGGEDSTTQTRVQSISSTCYMNGVMVNCSEIDTNINLTDLVIP